MLVFSEENKMPHSKEVQRLLFKDNPPMPAPAYPGRKSRNRPGGSVLTREEFLQQETDQWLIYVMNNPLYNTTFIADKAKCLIFHLQKSNSRRQGLTVAHCRSFIKNSEQRLLPLPESFQAQQQEQEEDEINTKGNTRTSLRAEDNPPLLAPPYQEFLLDNTLGGSVQTKEDFLREQTEQWLMFVREKPVYGTTSMAHKARCLALHLRKSCSKSNKITSAKCCSLVKDAEEKLLLNLEQDLEQIDDLEPIPGCSKDQEATEIENITDTHRTLDVQETPQLVAIWKSQVGWEEQEAITGQVSPIIEKRVFPREGIIANREVLIDTDDDDDEKDKDWSLDNVKRDRFKGRWKKEWDIEQHLKMSDQELFEKSDDDDNEYKNSLLKSNDRFKERRESYGRGVCERMDYQELFLSSEPINRYVEETQAYKERKRLFCEMFLHGKSTKEILCVEKNTLKVVLDSFQ